MIRFVFNKLERFEYELVAAGGGLLKFSIPISIMALYARNISLALRLMSTIALIFSVCARGLCVYACWRRRNERDKRAQRKWQFHFKSKINKEILILTVYDKQVPQSLCIFSVVPWVVVTTVQSEDCVKQVLVGFSSPNFRHLQ